MSALPGTQHVQAAAGRWAALTLVEQMAHIGSEVDRAVRAREGGREQRFEQALSRALELFDLTAVDPRWLGPRRREILRAREEFCRLFFDPDVANGSAASLRAYFLQFAVAARQRAAAPESSRGTVPAVGAEEFSTGTTSAEPDPSDKDHRFKHGRHPHV